jgi:hypothetical protein
LTDTGLVSAKEFYSDMQRSLNPSQISVISDKGDLKIKVKVVPADAESFKAFLNNLGVSDFGDQEIDIKLGESSAEFLDKVLRDNNLAENSSKSINLNLRILSKEIDFDNKKVFGPFDNPSENLLENPTSTGSITTKQVGKSGLLIEIDNPEKVLAESSVSGKLKLSDKLNESGWWQILPKLAKINLKVDDGVMTGVIYLK